MSLRHLALLRRPAALLLALAPMGLVGSVSAEHAVAEGVPASMPVRPIYTEMTEGVSTEVVVVRFQDETAARIRNGRIVSLVGADLAPVEGVLASVAGATISPRFPQGESVLDEIRSRGEARVKRVLPDLNLYAEIHLPPAGGDDAGQTRLADLLSALHSTPGIAAAWGEPLARAAVPPGSGQVGSSHLGSNHLGSDSGRSATESGMSHLGGSPQSRFGTTPDFSPLQGYLYEAPVGIEAESAWAFPGGLGQGIDFLDLEWGWLFAHEDLPDPFYAAGEYGTDDHGTAVLGEVAGIHNGFGINGIAPEVRAGVVSLVTFSIPGAILDAGTVLEPGDIFLMEVQCGGPVSWMPCEWWQDVFDAIEVVTATGVLCVEAGGNGTIDLDDDLYGDAFDRRVRDSGAIVVGAGTPNGLNAEGFSNYGSRTDLQGWGSSIVTTCCGDLQGGDPEVRYTSGFNGTSGASPIVVGALASLQGQSLELHGEPLSPDLAKEILSVTGSPWTGDRQIGERPNLVAARDLLVLGFGDVTVLVRDGDTLEPLDGRIVEVVESGRLEKTGPAGEAVLQLSATDLTLRAEGDFFYMPTEVPVTVIDGIGQEVTIDLFRAPFGEIAGQVRDESGAVVPNAEVAILEAPLPSVVTDANGDFVIGDVPANTGYELLASGVPGLGVGYAEVDVVGGETAGWNPLLPEANTFEVDGGGYTPAGEWERGTPNFPIQNPPPTFSGDNVWATNVDGPYGDVVISHLTSPVIDVTEADRALLTFHHWYWADPDDGGQLQVWDAGQNRWVVVEPIGGYPDESIQVLNFTGGYNGYTEEGYRPAVFDLSGWIGGDLQFRFYFRSNVSGHKLGWYIDDVALDLGLEDPAGVDGFPAVADGAAAGLRLLGAAPNPFRASSSIAFSVAAPGPVRVDLYDPSGALVRRLDVGSVSAGQHEVVWDGRTELGHEAGAGTYFYAVRAAGVERSGRIVRIR